MHDISNKILYNRSLHDTVQVNDTASGPNVRPPPPRLQRPPPLCLGFLGFKVFFVFKAPSAEDEPTARALPASVGARGCGPPSSEQRLRTALK